MDDHELRTHIESAARRGTFETRLMTARILHACWPGGSADRTEPAALGWLARWRPDTFGVRLVSCSCASGHCVLCN